MVLITFMLYVLLDVINFEILSGFHVLEQHEQKNLLSLLGCCDFSSGEQLHIIQGSFAFLLRVKKPNKRILLSPEDRCSAYSRNV